MKICPRCRTQFDDDLNYCLNDGSTLKDYDSFDPEDTISYTDDATLEFQNPQTANQNKLTNQTNYGQLQNARQSNPFMILGGIFGLVFLLFATIIGFGVYFYYQTEPHTTWYPTPTPYQDFPPPRTPTPEPKNNIKVEILEKVNGSFGEKYLKCKITNIGETIVSSPSITLMFYQDDVKIKEGWGGSKLKYLKPGQSVPVWVNLYGVDKYTSVKVKEPINSSPVSKSAEQLFPSLIFTETEMKGETGYMSRNFQQYKVIFYKVRGIIENQNYEKMSASVFVIFFDEKSEIIGIEETRVNLQKGEKVKFEVQEVETDLFGKPKSFEIITVAN